MLSECSFCLHTFKGPLRGVREVRNQRTYNYVRFNHYLFTTYPRKFHLHAGCIFSAVEADLCDWVAQWLVLSPHREHVPGSIPGIGGWSFLRGKLSHFKSTHYKVMGGSKLPHRVWLRICVCPLACSCLPRVGLCLVPEAPGLSGFFLWLAYLPNIWLLTF